MKAMIFAAGLGTRLRPLTDHCPKALLKVAGIPMLERVLTRLEQAGFDDITVNVHHLAGQITDYLQKRKTGNTRIHISDETGCLLDTGGGIAKARPFLDGDEPFLVHNADIATDTDLTALYRQHCQSGAVASLAVSQRKTSRYLLTDSSLRLRGWTNAVTGEVRPALSATELSALQRWSFGGIHVLSPAIFRLMEEGGWQGTFPIIPFYLSVCGKAHIQLYRQQATYWFDIGKPETLAQADIFLTEHADIQSGQ